MAAAGGGEGGGARILLEVAANSAHFALSVRCIHRERGGEGWRGGRGGGFQRKEKLPGDSNL